MAGQLETTNIPLTRNQSLTCNPQLMPLIFDEKGYLMPYCKIETSLEIFKQVFVSQFSNNSTRHELFVGYLHYMNDFRIQVMPNAIQWVGGSFVTQKESPNDIDFITLIDSEIYEEKEKLIDTSFTKDGARKKYGVDAFTVRIYPEKHPKFALTTGDLAYWYETWQTSRKDRFGRKNLKGFLELNL